MYTPPEISKVLYMIIFSQGRVIPGSWVRQDVSAFSNGPKVNG